MLDRFWRIAALLGLAILLYTGLSQPESLAPPLPFFVSSAHAGGVSVATENAATVFTASQDGKTIHMWQYYSSRPPKYVGKAEAILSE